MNRWNRFAGILGLVFLVFGILALLVLGGSAPGFTIFHLGAGIALLIYWVVTVGLRRIGEANQILSGRTVRFGISAILYTVFFVALLAGANWLAQKKL